MRRLTVSMPHKRSDGADVIFRGQFRDRIGRTRAGCLSLGQRLNILVAVDCAGGSENNPLDAHIPHGFHQADSARPR